MRIAVHTPAIRSQISDLRSATHASASIVPFGFDSASGSLGVDRAGGDATPSDVLEGKDGY
jgi:hypothetical protein